MRRFGLFLTAWVFILIFAGGLVTSTDSGLSVPDWPLSYGQVFPPMIGGIRYEHTHRVIAGFAGIFTLLFFLGSLKFDSRKWFKVFMGICVLVVALQAVLGGLTVIYLLPTWISVFHATLAQTFFCLILLSTYFMSREWKSEAVCLESKNSGSLKRLLIMTIAFIYAQLIIGSLVRHTGEAQTGLSTHFVVAFLVVLHIILSALKIARDPAFKTLLGHAFFALSLVLGQVFLGIGSWLITRTHEVADSTVTFFILLRTAHQTNGALILGVMVLLAVRAFRLTRNT